MTNQELFNWWKPYIGEKIHHKSHIEFKGLIVNYDTSWNKFKVKVTEHIDLNEAYLFYYLDIKDVKDYCGELSEIKG